MDNPKYWLNKREYPFSPKQYHAVDGLMKYLDEGQGSPIVFIHGNMTWSFMYRKVIENLRENFRCIALDHLGFGLSETPAKGDYTPEAHSRRLAQFIDHLGLTDVTLVMIDAGGPIGLRWASDHPEKLKRMIFLNTYAWNLDDNDEAVQLMKLLTGKFNRLHHRILQASPSFVLPSLFADRHRMSPESSRHYLKPFEVHDDRQGIYGIMDSWKTNGAWYDTVGTRAKTLSDKQVLILWGMKDMLFNSAALARFQAIFPHAKTVEFSDSGRFLTEEKPDEVIREIKQFLMTEQLLAS